MKLRDKIAITIKGKVLDLQWSVVTWSFRSILIDLILW